jgi:hypothetical protein
MTRKFESEATKERKRAYHRAYYAKRYADPEYRAQKQKYYAEKCADPEWHAAHKKKLRKYYRTRGTFLPNRKLSRQRSYYKAAADPERRQQQNAKIRQRYHSDPAFRAKSLARKRLRRARMKNLRSNRRAKPR